MQEALTVILAGGVGSRLSPLTDNRAKPAVPFGGKYRIIDFTLSNCLHSGLRKILVLTQYKSHSLQKHLRDGWSVFNPELGEYITAVPPQQRKGDQWYEGTADAIYQNLWLLSRSEAKYVVVLSGDHIYRMDYKPMLKQHKETKADLTIACMKVPVEEAKSFGVMSTDQDKHIVDFTEKPSNPTPCADDETQSLASMGIYIFSMDALINALESDAENPNSQHDFGHDIIPKLIDARNVYAYPFGDSNGRVSQDAYWRDVGTIDSFYEANMNLIEPIPPVDLYQREWTIRTYEEQRPPARTVASATGNEGISINSLVSSGTIISGGSVHHSILSPGVTINNGSTIQDSIVFDNVTIGEHCQLRNCIIDKHVVIPDGTQIGFNAADDAKKFTISENGVVVVPESYVFEQ
jgi:glucose-1-phosphate adenylyltransferase